MNWKRIETEDDYPQEDLPCFIHILDHEGEYIEPAYYDYDVGAWMVRGEYVSERDFTIIGYADASEMPMYEEAPIFQPIPVD